MRIIDLTHTFTNHMPVYPGDPHAALTQIAVIPEQGFTDHTLSTGLHVGTHMDAPLHMIAGGKRMSELPVERFISTGHLIDARGHESIPAALLDAVTTKPGDSLLILTGHSSKFHDADYYEHFPVISEEFAKRAAALNISLIGMDTPSPDVAPFPVHKILLSQDIVIIENLTNLTNLIDIYHFTVIALPLKLEADAAPARVVAMVE